MSLTRRASRGSDDYEEDFEELEATWDRNSKPNTPRYAINVVDNAVNIEVKKQRKVNDIETFIRSNQLALKKKRLEAGKIFAEKQFKQMRLKLKHDRVDFEMKRIKKDENLKKLHEKCKEVAKTPLPVNLLQRLSTEREHAFDDTDEYYLSSRLTKNVDSIATSPTKAHTLKSNLLSIHERISSGIDTLHSVGDEIAKQKAEQLKLKSDVDEKIRVLNESKDMLKKSTIKASPSKQFYSQEVKKVQRTRTTDTPRSQPKVDAVKKVTSVTTTVKKGIIKQPPKNQKVELRKKIATSSSRPEIAPKYAPVDTSVPIADVSLLGLIESDIENNIPVSYHLGHTAHLSEHMEVSSDSAHESSTSKSSEIFLQSGSSDDVDNVVNHLTDDDISSVIDLDVLSSDSDDDVEDRDMYQIDEIETVDSAVETYDEHEGREKDLNVMDQINRMNELILELNSDFEERLHICNSNEANDIIDDGDSDAIGRSEIPAISDNHVFESADVSGPVVHSYASRFIAPAPVSGAKVPYAVAAIKADRFLPRNSTETNASTAVGSPSNLAPGISSVSDDTMYNSDLGPDKITNIPDPVQFIDDPLIQTQNLLSDRDDAIKKFNSAASAVKRDATSETKSQQFDAAFTRKNTLKTTYKKENSDDEDDDNFNYGTAVTGATYKSNIPTTHWSTMHGLIPSLRNVGELGGMLDSQFKILSHERLAVPESSDNSKDYTDDESYESGDDDNRVVTLLALQLLKQGEESEARRMQLLKSKAIESMTGDALDQNIIQENVVSVNQVKELHEPGATKTESVSLPLNESTGKNVIRKYFETNADDSSDALDLNNNVESMPELADISVEIKNAISLGLPTTATTDPVSDDVKSSKNMYSALELRQFMIDELRKQDEILKYELELAELEQTRAIASANDYVQQVVMRSQIEAIENKKQQELVLQQQAYEMSLTAALASAHITLNEESALHSARIVEMQSQLQQQELQNDYAQLILHAESLQRQSFPVVSNSNNIGIESKVAAKVKSSVSERSKPAAVKNDDEIDEIIEEDDAYTTSFEQDRDSSVQEDLSIVERDKSSGSKYDSEYSDIFEEDIPEEIDSDAQSLKHVPVVAKAKPHKLKSSIKVTSDSVKQHTKTNTTKESSVATDANVIDTNSILAEYKNEMEIRLKTQEKSIQIRLQLLKAKRSKSLDWLSKQKEQVVNAKTLKAKKGLLSIKEIDAEEKRVNDSYNEERVVLEREKWSLNARAYRELRKFQQLKHDMDAYEVAYEPDITTYKVNAMNISSVYDSSASSNDSSFDLRKGEKSIEKSKRSTKTLSVTKMQATSRSDDSDSYVSPNKSHQSSKSKSPNEEFMHNSHDSSKSLGNKTSSIAAAEKQLKQLKQYEQPKYLQNEAEETVSLNNENDLQDKKEYETHSAILEKNIIDRQLRIQQLKTSITNIEIASKDHTTRRSKQLESEILENNERKLLSSLDNDIARIASELNTINQGLRVSRDSVDSKDSQFSSQEKLKEWIEAIHEPLHEEDSIMKDEDDVDNDSWASQEDIDSSFMAGGTKKRTSAKSKQVPTLLSSKVTNLDIIKKVKRDEAVTKIQSAVRGWSTRSRYDDYITEIRAARDAIASGSVIGDLPLEYVAANAYEDDVLDDSFGSNDGMEEYQVVQKLQKEQRVTDLLESKVSRMNEIKLLKESLANEQKNLEEIERLNQQKVEAELARLEKVRTEAEIERKTRQAQEAERLAQAILDEENNKLAIIKRETELALMEKQRIEQEEKVEKLRLAEMRKEIESLELLRISKIEEANKIVLKLKEDSSTVAEIEREKVYRLRLEAEKLKQETLIEEERLVEIAKQAELRAQVEEKRLEEIARQAAMRAQEEEKRLEEIAKQAELRAQEEEKRLEEIAKQAELRAQVEEKRLEEIAKQAELRAQVEEKRLEEIAKQAAMRAQEEEKRLVEIAKQAELRAQVEEKRLAEISKQVSDKDEELKRLDSARQDAEIQAGIMSLKLKRDAEEEADLLRKQLQSNAQKEANDLKVKLTNEVMQDVVLEQDKLSKLRLESEIEAGRLENLHHEKESLIKEIQSASPEKPTVVLADESLSSNEAIHSSTVSSAIQFNNSDVNDSSMLEEVDESIVIEDDPKDQRVDKSDALEQSGSATVAWDRDYRSGEGELIKSLSNSALCGKDNDSLSITSGTKTINTAETKEDINSLGANEDLYISDADEFVDGSDNSSIPEDDMDVISEASSYDPTANKLESSARSFGQSTYSNSHLSVANSSNNDDKDFSVVEELGTLSAQSYDLVKDNLMAAAKSQNIVQDDTEVRQSVNDISMITANTVSTADNSMLVDERVLLESIESRVRKDGSNYNVKEALQDQSYDEIDYELEEYASETSTKPSLSSLSNIPPLSLNKIPKLVVEPSLNDELDDLYQFDSEPQAAATSAHTVDTPRNDELVNTVEAPVIPVVPNWAPVIMNISNDILHTIDLSFIVERLKDETLAISDGDNFVSRSQKDALVKLAATAFSRENESMSGLYVSEPIIEGVVDAVNDRLSHILQELYSIYHDKSANSTRTGLGLMHSNKRTLIQSMPLTTESVSNYISNAISSEQQIIQDIVNDKRNINNLVTLDTVESVVAEEEVVYKSEIDNIADTILAKLIVDTAMVFRNRI